MGLFDFFKRDPTHGMKLPLTHNVQLGRHRLLLKTLNGWTVRPSAIGSSAWEGDKPVLVLTLPGGYNTYIFAEPIDIKAEYAAIMKHAGRSTQNNFSVVDEDKDYLIYKAQEGKIPFHSILATKQVDGQAFHTITEQVHFDENNNAVTVSELMCRAILATMRSIEIV